MMHPLSQQQYQGTDVGIIPANSHPAILPGPLLASMTGQGDPLADAAFHDYQHAPEHIRQLLSQGMHQGVSSISQAPRSFIVLLQDAEDALSELSEDTRVQARLPYLLIGPLWISVSLGPGALVHTYADPSIATVLMRTGNLSEGSAARRLLETQVWNLGILMPDGLTPGGRGYVQTLQVRLLHARIRRHLLEKGEHTPSPVVSIDQRQMIRTWLDFTLVAFQALERIGFEFSHEQKRPVYAMWRTVGRLLGIEQKVLSYLHDDQAASGLLHSIDSACPMPNIQSRDLTRAMLNAIGTRLAVAWNMPPEVSVLLAESLCRLFHGDALADLLGIGTNWTQCLLPVYADANRYRLGRAQSDPAFREEIFNRSLKSFEAIIGGMKGDAAFEQIVVPYSS